MRRYQELFPVCAIALLVSTAGAADLSSRAPVSPCFDAPRLPDPLIDPQSPLAQHRSLYFDRNSTMIKDEFTTLIATHAKLLRGDPTRNVPSRHILIIGYADERGSHEYNLALGAARADAVYRALAACGVPEARMTVQSAGKERPKVVGRDEAARGENRRVDIEYFAD